MKKIKDTTRIREVYANRMNLLLGQFRQLNDLSRKYNDQLSRGDKEKIIDELENQLKDARNNLFKETQTIATFNF